MILATVVNDPELSRPAIPPNDVSGPETASVMVSAVSRTLLALRSVLRASRSMKKTCTPKTTSRIVRTMMTNNRTNWTESIILYSVTCNRKQCQYTTNN